MRQLTGEGRIGSVKTTMAKLWDKGYSLDDLIERFTVGNDYLLDRGLLVADCIASMAHARTIERAGYLTSDDADRLVAELVAIAGEAEDGGIEIPRELEDGHTLIETRLTETLGDAGKRIHTGRSRNDQVIAATRLYGREALWLLQDACGVLVTELLDMASRHERTPMPGRTHTQVAMPSTVGLWAASYAEALIDDLELSVVARRMCDRSPLGSAAAYGVPLPLDREYTASLLGFERVQNNVLAVGNSRGKLESLVLDTVESIMLTLSKFASDLILFSLPEFGYFRLPRELCSGSSIMPQKRNPDALELLRARAGSVGGWASAVKNIIRSLPGGYNRDFQDTKEPFLRGLETGLLSLKVATRTVERMEIHEQALASAMSPELYATDAAFSRVAAGDTFRDAYRYVGTHLDELEQWTAEDALAARTSVGDPGNLNLQDARSQLNSLLTSERIRRADASAAIRKLTGREFSIVSVH